MEKMRDFYELLEISKNSSEQQIIKSYNNKLSKFNTYKKILSEHVQEIKLLKTALYILTNTELKNNYDILLKRTEEIDSIKIDPNIISQISNELSNNNTSINYSEKKVTFTENFLHEDVNNISDPVAGNMTNDDNLDSVFNIDNSWMNKNNGNNGDNGKKNKVETNLLGDRVFSLPQFGKKQNYPSDIDTDLRKPLQGRESKNA
jgi:curved DNA-binding protein CbpA